MSDSFVCLDLGASATRTVSNDGNVYIIPNNVVFVDAADKVDVAVHKGSNMHEEVLGALDVTIVKTSGAKCDFFPCRAIMGDMAERFSATCIRPSVLKNKVDQQVNFVSAIVGMAHQQLVANTDEDIDVILALPPMEVQYNSEKISNMLIGSYKVKFNRLEKEVNITIKSMLCVEEGYMALVTFFFNKDGSATANADKYGKGYVLMLDVGSSTTDVVVAKDKRYVEKSGNTIKTGCNVIEANVANGIRAQFGYDPTNEELDFVLRTGRLAMGNSYKDLTVILRRAKEEFARSIIEQLQSYFRLVNIPLQTIRAIVVGGGGSLESKFTDENGNEMVTTGSVSEYVTKELNRVVEGIDVICVDGDPREANINGAYIRAMLAITLRNRQKQAQ